MKKLLLPIIALSAFAANPALAKTEGFYMGINAINTKSKFDHIIHRDKSENSNNVAGTEDDNQTSIGMSYKYAFNFNGFFIAPDIFFDYSNLTLKDKYDDKLSLDYRYGAKLDVGFDVGDRIAIFGSAGGVNSHNTVRYNSPFPGPGFDGTTKTTSNTVSFLYGGGVKLSVSDNVDLNVTYDISETEMKDPDQEFTVFKIHTAKAGLSYRF